MEEKLRTLIKLSNLHPTHVVSLTNFRQKLTSFQEKKEKHQYYYRSPFPNAIAKAPTTATTTTTDNKETILLPARNTRLDRFFFKGLIIAH